MADEAGSDPIPNAGGEGGHRAATPDVASHRYSDSPMYEPMGPWWPLWSLYGGRVQKMFFFC